MLPSRVVLQDHRHHAVIVLLDRLLVASGHVVGGPARGELTFAGPFSYRTNREVKMKSLLNQTKVTQAIAPTAGVAGQTDIEGATLDMAGFEGVLVKVLTGAITAGAVTGVVMQQSNASDMSGAETLAGPAITVADDDDNKVLVLDLYRPTKRYVRVHVDRATQNAAIAGATYEQYGARSVPIDSASSTVKVASAVSPSAA